MELLLVLDRSGSIGRSMPTLLSFARDLVGEFEIGPSFTRVGLVQFNHDADVLLSLSSSIADIESGISVGGPAQGMTSISDGVTRAVGLLSAARSGVPVTMLVLTDGVQTVDGGDPAAIAAATAAKAQGVQLFAVGFGPGPRHSTLEAMASPPTSTHALLFASIEEVRAYFGRNGLCVLSGPQAPPLPPSAPLPPHLPLETSACDLSRGACERAALARGMTAGGCGYGFVGDYATKGCYS